MLLNCGNKIIYNMPNIMSFLNMQISDMTKTRNGYEDENTIIKLLRYVMACQGGVIQPNVILFLAL